MAHINLLPYREERRKEQQRQFLTVLGLSVVLTVLIIGVVHLHFAGEIENQNSRNRFLQAEIARVDAQISEINQLEQDRQRLLARMQIIQQLQRNRPEVVHLFDELVRILPDGVHLTSLKQTGQQLEIEGMAQSNARISAFMRNLDGSDWMTRPLLNIIQRDAGSPDGSRRFVLRVTQVSQIVDASAQGQQPAARR